MAKNRLVSFFRRNYNKTFFDSMFLKAGAPFVDFLDRASHAKAIKNSERTRLPPFSLRVRSAGVWKQLGAERFVKSGDIFLDFLRAEKLLSDSTVIADIGCGVGKLAYALERNATTDNYYIGVDIDKKSVAWCLDAFTEADRFEFHFVDASNEVYNRSGGVDPKEQLFQMLEGKGVDLVVLWSVFTHMELEHIQHYLAVLEDRVSAGGYIVFSCFIYDDRESIRNELQFPRNGGYVANLDRPMKQIGFTENALRDAIALAGLVLEKPPMLRAEPGEPAWPTGGLGQDIFICKVPSNELL